MALVNLDTVLVECIRYIKSCPANSGMELMSYKRNRTIAITSLGHKKFLLIEKGYTEDEYEVDIAELPKILKKAMKREFPRSRKVRLVKFDDPTQLTRLHQKI